MPTVKIHLFLRLEKKRKNINTQRYYTNQMTLHLGSYRNIPELDAQGRQMCTGWAPVLCLLSRCPCAPYYTGVYTCLLVTPPKSCAILIWGDTVTNTTMCKSSDLLKWNPNDLKLTTSNFLNRYVKTVLDLQGLTSRSRLDEGLDSVSWGQTHETMPSMKHIR